MNEIDIEPIYSSERGSVEDGYGEPTFTVSELIAELQKLPPECRDMPVERYCSQGIYSIEMGLHWESEDHNDDWTQHVRLR
jgi:hypothetical protein